MGLFVGGLAGSRDGTIGTEASFASDEFVNALGLQLVAGRELLPSDSSGAPRVMVVSHSLAARLWPGQDPIGQRARHGNAQGAEVTVVGAVDDAKFILLGGPSATRAYLPVKQEYCDWETLVVHTCGNPERTIRQLREAIARIDPTLPLSA